MARQKNSATQKSMAEKELPTSAAAPVIPGLCYRPLDGHGIYDAVLVRENPSGTVDIVVVIPGSKDGLALRRIQMDSANPPARGCCCQKKTAGAF